mmetsp:Transcript_59377/g.193736  ORF Transcript_59377/g.193736 Transcript_59377/m.193736 type:complete len:468 (-) Transcript_59377:870-2273(-)
MLSLREGRIVRRPIRWAAASSRHEHGPAHAAALLPLHESRLVLQGAKRLLEALNLCLAASRALLVSLGLGDATLLDLAVVLQNRLKLGACRLTIRRQLRDGSVQRLRLLGLVLHVLLLHRLGDLVLLRNLLVLRLRIVLLRLLLGEVVGEIRFHYLKEAKQAAAGTRCLAMVLRRGRLLHEGTELVILEQSRRALVVLANDAQGLANSIQAKFEVGLCGSVVGVRLKSDHVHLGLLLRQRPELGLQNLHVLFELCGLGSCLVDLGGQLGDVIVQLALLGLRLRHLLITVTLLVGLAASLFLQLGNHIRNEALDFAENILAVRSTEPRHSTDARGQLSQRRRVMLPCQVLHQGDHLGAHQVGAALHPEPRQGGRVELQQRVALRHSARRRLDKDLLRLCDSLQLLGARCDSGLVVCSNSHASRMSSGKHIIGAREVFLGHLQISLGGCLALLGLRLSRLLGVNVLGVS